MRDEGPIQLAYRLPTGAAEISATFRVRRPNGKECGTFLRVIY